MRRWKPRCHGNIAPAHSVQITVDEARPQFRIAERRCDAQNLQFRTAQRQRERKRIVDVVAYVRIQNGQLRLIRRLGRNRFRHASHIHKCLALQARQHANGRQHPTQHTDQSKNLHAHHSKRNRRGCARHRRPTTLPLLRLSSRLRSRNKWNLGRSDHAHQRICTAVVKKPPIVEVDQPLGKRGSGNVLARLLIRHLGLQIRMIRLR